MPTNTLLPSDFCIAARRQKFRVVSPFLFTAAGIAGAIYGTELWHEYNVQKE
jgi:hypothetical protein